MLPALPAVASAKSKDVLSGPIYGHHDYNVRF
jgi:hypothetical protein